MGFFVGGAFIIFVVAWMTSPPTPIQRRGAVDAFIDGKNVIIYGIAISGRNNLNTKNPIFYNGIFIYIFNQAKKPSQ